MWLHRPQPLQRALPKATATSLKVYVEPPTEPFPRGVCPSTPWGHPHTAIWSKLTVCYFCCDWAMLDRGWRPLQAVSSLFTYIKYIMLCKRQLGYARTYFGSSLKKSWTYGSTYIYILTTITKSLLNNYGDRGPYDEIPGSTPFVFAPNRPQLGSRLSF